MADVDLGTVSVRIRADATQLEQAAEQSAEALQKLGNSLTVDRLNERIRQTTAQIEQHQRKWWELDQQIEAVVSGYAELERGVGRSGDVSAEQIPGLSRLIDEYDKEDQKIKDLLKSLELLMKQREAAAARAEQSAQHSAEVESYRNSRAGVTMLTYSLRRMNTMLGDSSGFLGDVTSQLVMFRRELMNARMAGTGWTIAAVAGLAVGIIASIVSAIKDSAEEVKKAREEAIQTATETIRTYESEHAAIQKNFSVLLDNTSSTEDLTQAKNALAQSLDSVVIGYDAEGNAILKSNAAIAAAIELTEKQLQNQRQILAFRWEDFRKEQEAFIKQSEENIASFGTKPWGFLGDLFGWNPADKEQFANVDFGLAEEVWKAENVMPTFQDVVISYIDGWDQMSDAQKRATYDIIYSYRDIAHEAGSVEKCVAELNQYYADTDDIYKTIEENDKIIAQVREMGKDFDQQAQKIDRLQSAYNTLAKGGTLSAQQLHSLAEEFPIINKYLQETGDLTLQNGQIAKVAAEQFSAAAVTKRQEEIRTLEILKESSKQSLKLLYDQINAYDTLANAVLYRAVSEAYAKEWATLKEVNAALARLQNGTVTLPKISIPATNMTAGGVAKIGDAADDSTKSLDRLGKALVSALKERYEQQRAAEEQRINESIKSWDRWEDETVAAIRGQIDALDALEKKQESEDARAEYERQKQALELKKAYEHDAYQREQYQKEINRLEAEEQARLNKEARELIRSQLEDQIDAAQAESKAKQDALKEQLEAIQQEYAERLKTSNLEAEAQRLVTQSTQTEIISLLKSYAPDYELAGRSLGDKLADGFRGGASAIESYIKTIQTQIDTFQTSVAAQANAAADRFWASRPSGYDSAPQVNVSVSFNAPVDSPIEVRREIERVMDQVAAEISRG